MNVIIWKMYAKSEIIFFVLIVTVDLSRSIPSPRTFGAPRPFGAFQPLADANYPNNVDTKIAGTISLENKIAVQGDAGVGATTKYTYAKLGEFTYLVTLLQYYYSFCRGALLSERWVLTTATCIEQSSQNHILILVGAVTEREGDIYICESVKVHEQFNSAPLENDIALVSSNRPILFTPYVQPIPYFRASTESCRQDATFIGFKEFHNSMYPSMNFWATYMNVSQISKEECQTLLTSSSRSNSTTLICMMANVGDPPSNQNALCYAKGGELLITSANRMLLGLKLMDYNCDSRMPFAFTRVSHFAQWIEENANVIGVDVI